MPIPSGRRASDANNSGKFVTIYVYSVLILTFLAIASVLGIIILRPGSTENSTLIAAVLGIITPSILLFTALIQQESHKSLNSRMDQLAELRRTEGYTEGLLTGAATPIEPSEAIKLLEVAKPSPLIPPEKK